MNQVSGVGGRLDRAKMARAEKYKAAIEAGFYQAPLPGGGADGKDAVAVMGNPIPQPHPQRRVCAPDTVRGLYARVILFLIRPALELNNKKFVITVAGKEDVREKEAI